MSYNNERMTDIYTYVKYSDPFLDFVNSKVWNTRVEPFTDLFAGYDDVVHWLKQLNILSDAEVVGLLRLAKQNPDETQKAFEKIITLRDTNYRLFTAIAHQQTPTNKDIEVLNRYLQEAMRHRDVTYSTEGFNWDWINKKDSLDWMLWPLALSTAELLTSDRVQRVRECNGCYWLFMDNSRNGLRRWCDMKTCGNRAKAHRHYERTKISKN